MVLKLKYIGRYSINNNNLLNRSFVFDKQMDRLQYFKNFRQNLDFNKSQYYYNYYLLLQYKCIIVKIISVRPFLKGSI